MSDLVGMRVRCLPAGDFRDAFRVSAAGRFWGLNVTGEPLPLGSLLEIEQGSTVYWGELRQMAGSTALVCIEHSLDRSRLQPIREIWGA